MQFGLRSMQLTAALMGSALIASALVAPSAFAVEVSSNTNVRDLKVNGRTDPVGLPTSDPTFGWITSSPQRGVTQTAYQVIVGTSPNGSDVWDSGKVSGDDQVGIAYGGPDLQSNRQYFWSVRTWDGAGAVSSYSAPAIFETGLSGPTAWSGASWIADGSKPDWQSWRDYTATTNFTIERGAFGMFVRASDTSNGYMWQLMLSGDRALLRPHITRGGSYSLLGEVDLSRFGITATTLRSGTHKLEITATGNRFVTTLDGVQVDDRTDGTFPAGFVGVRTHPIDNTSARIDDLTVTAADGKSLLKTSFDDNPLTAGVVDAGKLVVSGAVEALPVSDSSNMPAFRKDLTVRDGLVSARVYASAHGVYEMSINGQTVGDQKLAPGWTDYRTRIQSQTYDVTKLLKPGANTVGAIVSDGWWAGTIGLDWREQYGKRADKALIAKIRLDYADGRSEWISTDNTWTSGKSAFRQADLQDGENYDARAEQSGWNSPGFDSTGWGPVRVIDSSTSVLTPQPDEPVRETQVLSTVNRTEPSPGVFIYDVGQNMVGVAAVTVTGRAGDRIRIRHGEELNKDGSLYTANLRSADATDYYTFATDGAITYEPRFTQHGFRYIEVSGARTAPGLNDVKGKVWESDLPDTGTLSTSSELLNKLGSNISWGQRGNFVSIPTDTPARDERLGWTGDIGLFAPTASYLKDTRAFLGKWMTDVRDAQYDDGNLPSVIPFPPNRAFGETGIAWSDAAITVPHAVWESSDDQSIIRDNWDTMTEFFSFVRASAGDDLLETGRATWFSQDWLNLDDPTPIPVLGTAYYAEDAEMMSEMAAAIGKTDEAREWAALSDRIEQEFVKAYVSADGTVQGGAQTGYALALGFDLIQDPSLKAKVGQKFIEKLERTDFHLTTGFVGTPQLLPALTAIGRDDLAYRMINTTTYPSWGYEVATGATTMWERWNSILPNGDFGDVSMNSFNHYAYGAVGNWMYQQIGGLQAVEAGYKKSRVAPSIGGGLTSGKGSLDTSYGKLASDWSVAQDGSLRLMATIPANTSSTIVIPASSEQLVRESGVDVANAPGVKSVSFANGRLSVEVGSGTYDFTVQTPASTVKVDATASTRKIGGKAYVTVTAVNRSAMPAQIDIVTAYGKKTFTDVRPNQTVSAAINSAKTTIPAGKATVTATATIDGKKTTSTVEAPYKSQN